MRVHVCMHATVYKQRSEDDSLESFLSLKLCIQGLKLESSILVASALYLLGPLPEERSVESYIFLTLHIEDTVYPTFKLDK